MREIPLTKSRVALVDDEDYEGLMRWHWHSSERKLPNGGIGVYAARKTKKNKVCKTIYMHRQICGCALHSEKVDHRDHNTLNNQRYNLRVGTQTQNLWNSRMPTRNTSGFKGVCWDKSKGKWQATIHVGKKARFLGRFDRKEDAAAAYDVAAVQFAGEFAFTNQQIMANDA
jgi:hypothetical protein